MHSIACNSQQDRYSPYLSDAAYQWLALEPEVVSRSLNFSSKASVLSTRYNQNFPLL